MGGLLEKTPRFGTGGDMQWWKERVVYQIYPRSFQDSNGDGFGDLNGIISRLDYLKALGVGILWLSPVYPSPQCDNGYDISDYRSIDSRFGSLEDFDRLVAEAKARDIRIVMDLVVNHSSDQHEWFLRSRRGEKPYDEYYIWRKGRGKRPPNNWTSFFGGSAWTFDAERGEWYLHLFAPEQPDLNYRSEAVCREVEGVLKFWLDRGVAGFRCDVINILWKDSLKNGFPKPALTGSEYYLGREGTHELLKRFHSEVLLKYDCFTVGETVFVTPKKAKLLTDPARGELDMVFAFEHMETDCFFIKWLPLRFKPARLYKVLDRWQKKLPWNANYLENHDQPRSLSRFGSSKEPVMSAKALATLLLCLRGTPFLYQGQELGMKNADFTDPSQVQDVESKRMVTVLKKLGYSDKHCWKLVQRVSRDNARTPMQWDGSREAGFTMGTPWLKVNDGYKSVNAAAEEADESSVLWYYRRLIAFRKDSPALLYGSYKQSFQYGSCFGFERRYRGKALGIVVNLSDKKSAVPAVGKVIFGNSTRKLLDCELEPWEALILER